MLFSQRMGLKPARKALQVDDVDNELRSALWSMFHECVLKGFRPDTSIYPATGEELEGSNLQSLFFRYWYDLYQEPTDTIPFRFERAVQIVRERFFQGSYGDVYDFREITLDSASPSVDLQLLWNGVLERHNSAYRLIDGVAVRITSEVEITAIESALDTKLKGVRLHLKSAMEKLSDRKHPDYRNSVKESISAVESLAQALTGNEKSTLGDALKLIAPAVGMHGAFRDALAKLYGYTSDTGGIRHALLDESTVTSADALFMLVACSAFVNYTLGKAAEGKIKLQEVKRSIPKPSAKGA